ncbi:MAG: FecR domain-containing protein [Bacteroidota bacterium]
MIEAYLTYSAKDFAKDSDFIAWAKHGTRTRAWEKWLVKHPDKRSRVAAALTYLQNTPDTPSPERVRVLMTLIYPSENSSTSLPFSALRNSGRKKYWWMYAAILGVLLAISSILFLQYDRAGKTIVANRAEQKKHTLPDGSIVRLNAASQLSYNPKKWHENRSLQLEGEAFFEVKTGSKFTVYTPSGEVSVLGTSFNVNARNKVLEVACFTGSVAVKHRQTGEQVKIHTQEQIALAGQKLQKTKFDMQAQATWRKGSFYYKRQPLYQILDEIERQYDVYIKASKTLEDKYVDDFYFDLRESLDNTVQNIGRILDVQVEMRGDTILLK